jgi:hypothetical protein
LTLGAGISAAGAVVPRPQLFSQHAADYQAMAAQATAFNEQFAQNLTAGAFSYAGIEAAITSFLQDLPANALASITPMQLANDAAAVALILFFRWGRDSNPPIRGVSRVG